MHIAVLSDVFLTQEHKKRLERIGEVSYYTDTTTEEVAKKRLEQVNIAIGDCFVTPFTKDVFLSTHVLRYISLNSTGYDGIDLASAQARNIVVSNIPGFSTQAVAEHTFALIFSVLRKIPQMDHMVRTQEGANLAHHKDISLAGYSLQGKTMGIIGLGAIGTKTAELARSFGMRVLATTKSSKHVFGVSSVSLETLLLESDVVSLHAPLTAETTHLIGRRELSLMKSTAILINTARGKEIDEHALFEALSQKRLFGAGLDVLEDETKDNPLKQLANVVFTPHSAWLTTESIEHMAEMCVGNVEHFVLGKPRFLIT